MAAVRSAKTGPTAFTGGTTRGRVVAAEMTAAPGNRAATTSGPAHHLRRLGVGSEVQAGGLVAHALVRLVLERPSRAVLRPASRHPQDAWGWPWVATSRNCPWRRRRSAGCVIAS